MIRSTKTALIGTLALAGAIALAGCSGGDTGNTDADVPGPSITRTATPEPSGVADGGISFEQGSNLDSQQLPAWSIQVSGLKEWGLTASDPVEGSFTYTKSNGTQVTVVQQQVTDLTSATDDRTATERLFTAAGYPVAQLEVQLLPNYSSGTVEFLSAAGRDSETGKYGATVARAFARPKVALTLSLTASSEDALKTDLHEFLVNAQVGLS